MPRAVIAIYNPKGGVTKTTTCASLAVALHQVGHRPILMVDCDPNASLSTSFGVSIKPGEPSLYEGLLGEGLSLKDVIRPVRDGLDLIPSHRRLAAAEKLLADEAGGEVILRQALLEAGAPYEYVLLDTPPNLGKLNVSALTAADGIVVPVTPEFLSLGPLQELTQTIRNVQARLNPRLRIFGLLLTKHDRRTLHAQEVEQRVRTLFPGLVFDDVVSFSVRFQEAPIGAQTILDYAPDHPGAVSYRAVALQLIERITAHETTPAERSSIS